MTAAFWVAMIPTAVLAAVIEGVRRLMHRRARRRLYRDLLIENYEQWLLVTRGRPARWRSDALTRPAGSGPQLGFARDAGGDDRALRAGKKPVPMDFRVHRFASPQVRHLIDTVSAHALVHPDLVLEPNEANERALHALQLRLRRELPADPNGIALTSR